MHVNYDSKNPMTPIPNYRVTRHQTVSESVIEGSAAVTVGVYGKVGVAPLVKEIAAIEAESKLGVTVSSAIDWTAEVAPIEILNTEMYDEINRDDFYRADVSLSGEISLAILGNTKLKSKMEFGDLLFKNPIFACGVVPRFDNVSLANEGDPGSLSASATLGRKLMFGVPVGFALYDENNKFVDKWWSDTEYKNNEGRTITHKFEGLNSNATYTLHPITRAFNDNMVANPSDDAKIEISLATWDATQVQGTSATLCGYVKGLSNNDNYTCGFYYGTEPTVGPENGTFVESTEIADGKFTVNVNNLQSQTTYYFIACVTLRGKTMFAETAKQFKTHSTAQITGNMELISFSATAGWNGGRSYEGLYRVTFNNLDDREIRIEGNLLWYGDGYISVVNDEQHASLPHCEPLWVYVDSTNDWYKIQYIDFDSENNSALLWMSFGGKDMPWENDTSKWQASVSKPGGMKFPYKVMNSGGEEGEIIVDFDIRYNQKPRLSNFTLISETFDGHYYYNDVRFNVSGCHWIQDAKVEFNIFSDPGEEPIYDSYGSISLEDDSKILYRNYDTAGDSFLIPPCRDKYGNLTTGIIKATLQYTLLNGEVYLIGLNFLMDGYRVLNWSCAEMSDDISMTMLH